MTELFARRTPHLPQFDASACQTVVCPRKSPLGDEVSVMKCVYWHRTDPDTCGACQKHVIAAIGARGLEGLGWSGRTRPPSGSDAAPGAW